MDAAPEMSAGRQQRFLVTGSAGLVGSRVTADLAGMGLEVHSCYHRAAPDHGVPVRLDLSGDVEGPARDIMRRVGPDVVIHLGAVTDVDLCEGQEELAFAVNARATGHLAEAAAGAGAFFVYISTDYVFDGSSGMYGEDDAPGPVGAYGRSKLAGELSVRRAAGPGDARTQYAIVRTSTPFGPHRTRRPFPVWVAERLRAGRRVPALTDQFTSPTYVPNLSSMIIEIASRRIGGIMHAAGASRVSRYELALMVARRLGAGASLVRPARMGDMEGWTARRPRDSSLDVSRASALLRRGPVDAETGVRLLLAGS